MPSFLGLDLNFKDGQSITPTIDCFTWGGVVRLAHASQTVVDADYTRIEELEKTTLFSVTAEDPAQLPIKDSIVVVDPFSTGAVIAHTINRILPDTGVICVYSADLDTLGGVERLIPQGLEIHFDQVVSQHPTQEASPKAAAFKADVNATAAKLRALPANITAVLAGAETGVEMADCLSEALTVRSNGSMTTEARRNKSYMGEAIRLSGLNAVLQKQCKVWSEVLTFLQSSGVEETEPYRVIVKPTESAGSDGVTLCRSRGEVEKAFHALENQVNQLGQVNTSVLVQEYLDGQEYVVDSVSRNGEHKCVAVWVYV